MFCNFHCSYTGGTVPPFPWLLLKLLHMAILYFLSLHLLCYCAHCWLLLIVTSCCCCLCFVVVAYCCSAWYRDPVQKTRILGIIPHSVHLALQLNHLHHRPSCVFVSTATVIVWKLCAIFKALWHYCGCVIFALRNENYGPARNQGKQKSCVDHALS